MSRFRFAAAGNSTPPGGRGTAVNTGFARYLPPGLKATSQRFRRPSMNTSLNRQLLLARHPTGRVLASDFRLAEVPVPALVEGQVQVRTIYLSIDPTMRIWLHPADNYLPMLQPGEVMRAVSEIQLSLTEQSSAAKDVATRVERIAQMTETKAVSSRRAAANSSRCGRPPASTRNHVTSQPSRASCSQRVFVALCSIEDVTMWRLPGCAAKAPRIAVVIDSVPPPVKTTESAEAPSIAATCARALAIAARAVRPAACGLEGLPKFSPRNGNIASRTRGSIGVVALLSR